MIQSLLEEIKKINKKRFEDEMLSIARNHTMQFLYWLGETDFYEAPASTTFHTNLRGGLCQHSLNVLDAGIKLNTDYKLGLEKESIVLVCLLHDLCKVNFYKEKEVWDKEHKEKTGEWKKKTEWTVDDQFPVGHGEKSVFLALRYLELRDEEIAAIRWHMSFSDIGVNFFYPSGAPYKVARGKYPLVRLIIIADQIAEFIETYEKMQ